MNLRNNQIAEILRRYASLLAFEGDNPFKVRAYRRGADALESWRASVWDMVAQGESLESVPHVGKGLNAMIRQIISSGGLPDLEAGLARLGPHEIELLDRPGLDAKRILRIYRKLKIRSLAELKARSDAGEIESVFGPRVGQHVRLGLDERKSMLLWNAETLAREIEDWFRALPAVRVERIGSLRRRRETVEQLDFLINVRSPLAVVKSFTEFGPVQSALEPVAKNERTFALSLGRRVRLVWTAARRWGTAVVEQTGSDAHLAQLRARAGNSQLAQLPDTADEGRVYRKLGLEPIEPELREGRGEIEAAAQGKLPRLVRRSDIRGDLHMHTTASDGTNSIEEMAQAAQGLGYQYIALADHSQSLKIANGLSEERLLEQLRAIDRLNAGLSGFTILKAAEVDILEDGRLDYSDEVLKQLDLTVCSIHSQFKLDRRTQTERILRAMDNPYFNILGHATGRMLLRRPGYEIDVERVLKHAVARGCLVEINSNPNRLDLCDEHARMAKELGIRIAINTDAHSVQELEFMSAGIDQARRAWLEAGHVLNTLPLEKLRETIRRK